MRFLLRKHLIFCGLAILIIGISACSYLSYAAASYSPKNPDLVELSGITRSITNPQWLWGHNDSGDSPRLFRVGPHGEDGGIVTVLGAQAKDWEDIATFTTPKAAMLLIGDIGDNFAMHDFVTLYAVADVDTHAASTNVLWSLRVQYPDGPRDAEGLGVDPITQDIFIISKRDRPAHIYRIAMPQTPPTENTPPVVAEWVGTVAAIKKPTKANRLNDPIYGYLRDWITAFSIAPNGQFVVVTTYKDAYLYKRTGSQTIAQMLQTTPTVISLPQFRQIEAGGISHDGKTLYIGSEKHGGFAAVGIP